jgi:hypothetical protein
MTLSQKVAETIEHRVLVKSSAGASGGMRPGFEICCGGEGGSAIKQPAIVPEVMSFGTIVRSRHR